MDLSSFGINYGPEFQRYNSQYGNALEKIGWTWYDTVPYVSAATNALRAFGAIRATLNLGNMEIAGQLASPKAFFVRAIRVKMLGDPFVTTAAADGNPQTGSVDDAALLLETGVLQFTIGQKNYGQWPLWMLPAGGGIKPFFQTGDIDVVVQYANNGVEDPRAVYSLSVPVFIGPQMNFAIDLLWPAGPVTLDQGNINIWVGLDGDLLRPVQ
ncbi:MAG: hypothetical protein WC329_04400 [Candidatus Omnitrophota bacterium]|jgi:hypothetical protein